MKRDADSHAVVPFDWGAIDAGALNLVVLVCAQLSKRKIEAFKHDSYLRSFDLLEAFESAVVL